ncbi:MAG: hypothetical protein WCO00_16505 [Rhodospirillaceae bacterium]
MKPSRSSALILLLVACGLVLAHGGAPFARTADPAGPTLVVASTAGAEGSGSAVQPARKATGLIDPKSVFFGCATGTVIGALVTALPPMVGWTFYAGALPAVVALVATSGIGCAVGLFGGVIVSTFSWIFDKIGGAWHAVFG